MPINVYTGLMGSGKSYECVSSVIIPAVRSGRRIVTNVDGIDNDAIRAYCFDKYSIPMDQLGHVTHCTNDDVAKNNFLPYDSDTPTFCQRGDIVCIDEAWRFWGTDCKLLPEHKIFFREHRHFVDPVSKTCCDLVLMVQDISDLNRTLKVVVEVTFRTTKIKALGWNKTYRVEMWEGYKLTIRGRMSTENKRYDIEIYPLYSSYTGGTGKELQIDSRQNILKNPKVWMLAVATIFMFCVSLYALLGFFNGSRSRMINNIENENNSVTKSEETSTENHTLPSYSDRWRIVGRIRSGMSSVFVLVGPTGHIRLESPSMFQNSGALTIGEVDGQRATVWTGPRLSQSRGAL